MYQTPICKNDRCSALVSPSKNSGVKKVFCSTRCARRYHSRLQYEREAGPGGQLVFVNTCGEAQVSRRLSPTSKAARQRLELHLKACALHKGPCPAIGDPYGRRKLCLIAAVFGDDWGQLRDSEEGKPVKRHSTTRDGRWLDDLTTEERTAETENVPKWEISEEQRQTALLAGAAKVTDPWNGRDDVQAEVLRKVNEGLPFSAP